jgi:probable rRNA maturation factor
MTFPEGSTVTFRRTPTELRPRALVNFARKLQREVSKGRPFDCLITGDTELRRLNREFRGKDEATDVLSFRWQSPQSPNSAPGELGNYGDCHRNTPELGDCGDCHRNIGDLAISLARARAQAREFGHSTEQEVRVLMLHGVLHLLGMDHDSDSGQMARAEKRWRARLGLPNGLIERMRP